MIDEQKDDKHSVTTNSAKLPVIGSKICAVACQLDDEIFTCCKCGGEFDVTQGTWLPIGIEDKSEITTEGEYPTILHYGDFLRPPEIITSDDFTCYECGG